MKLAMITAGVCIVLGLTALLFASDFTGLPAGPNSSIAVLDKPAWNVGDWWTIEESYLVVQAAVADPPWVGPMTKRIEVTGIERVDNEDCYVVAITGDSPGAPDTIYYRTDNLSLVKVDRSMDDVHFVYGGERVNDGMSPKLYMVPSFPARAAMVSADAVSFGLPGVANASKADYSNVTGGYADAKYYVVENPGGYPARQIWHPGVPWWLYHDEPYLKARLVDCSWWHK